MKSGQDNNHQSVFTDLFSYEGSINYSIFLPEGEGICTDLINFSTFSGDFKNGKIDGQGILAYSNGSTLKGQFQLDSLHLPTSKGRIYIAVGNRKGRFNGLLQGKGYVNNKIKQPTI